MIMGKTTDTYVGNLNPLAKTLVPGEDLHGRLGVRVVGGLEAEVGVAGPCEELLHKADEVAEGDVVVGDDALDLVELCQVGGVGGLVTEDAVDGEHLCGLEAAGLVGNLVEHVGGDGGGVGAKEQLLALGVREGRAVADRAVAADLVRLLDALKVRGVGLQSAHGVLDVERVLQLAGGVLLRHE